MSYLANATNISNDTNPLFYCETPQYFSTLSEFYTCYKYFQKDRIFDTVAQIFLGCGMVGFNLLVFLLLMYKPDKSVFDKILMGHCKYFF